MIDPSILRAMLAAGATAEMIVVAVEAAYKADSVRREYIENYERDRKRSYRLTREIMRRDGNQCRYCGVTTGPFHVDHIVPRSRGGTSSSDNLVIACASCNLSKGDRTLEELGWVLMSCPGQVSLSGTKKKGPHTPKEKIYPLDNPSGYLPPQDLVFRGAFEDFWTVYPRKVGKGAARKAYRNARKRASEDQIISGAKRYAESRPDPEFTKHPATWLNADCWLDETGKVIDFHNPPKRSWAEIKAEREAKRET